MIVQWRNDFFFFNTFSPLNIYGISWYVKSKQGKMSQGLNLLNKALETYRDLQDEEANFEIALALLELGNGYVTG
jgi:hypothetical protein